MTAPVFDPDVIAMLRELAPPGKPDVLREVLEAFMADAPMRLDDLEAAARSGSADAVMRAAHVLKGSALNLGAGDFSGLCKGLEAAGRAGSLEGAEAMAAAIRGEYAKVREAALRLLGEA